MDIPETESTDNRKRRQSDLKRLESWKAIANYLNRSVRTVRRWEADQNLPVRRQRHSKGYSVYSYCAELDAWRQHHELQDLQQSVPAKPRTRAEFPRIRRYAAIAIVAAFVSGVAVRLMLQRDPAPGMPATAEVGWVLIATPEVSGELRPINNNFVAALRQSISESQTHRPLSRERINDALRLMRQDSQTILSPAVAADVAVRDGRVSALVVPRVEYTGESFVLSVTIIDANDNILIGYPREKVGSILPNSPAYDRVIRDVVAVLSRLPKDTRPEVLPQVTTSSIAALRNYSKALQLLKGDHFVAARELLGLAIEEDSDFASARALQAWTLKWGGAGQEVYREVSKTAAENDSRVLPYERYFIEGSQQHFSGDLDRAEASYRTVLELEPDHVFAAQAIVEICIEMGRRGDCGLDKARVARLRPDHFESNLQAAWALAANGSNVASADYFAKRSLELLEAGDGVFAAESVARALILPVVGAWVDADPHSTSEQIQILRENLPVLPEETGDILIRHMADLSLVLGQVDEARNLTARLRDPVTRYELQARILFASGDKETLRAHLELGTIFRESETALFMSMSGLAEDAVALHGQLSSDIRKVPHANVIRAIIEIGEGRLDSAKTRLRGVVSTLPKSDAAFALVASDMLAEIYKAEGDVAHAVNILESTTVLRDEAIHDNAGMFWLMCQQHLASLYREAGRQHDAIRIEDVLRRMLILADDDFPLGRS